MADKTAKKPGVEKSVPSVIMEARVRKEMLAQRNFGSTWGVDVLRPNYPTTVEEALAEKRAELAALKASVPVAETTYRGTLSLSATMASPEAGLQQAFKVPRSGV